MGDGGGATHLAVAKPHRKSLGRYEFDMMGLVWVLYGQCLLGGGAKALGAAAAKCT
jgi:hypothetical protein